MSISQSLGPRELFSPNYVDFRTIGIVETDPSPRQEEIESVIPTENIPEGIVDFPLLPSKEKDRRLYWAQCCNIV